MNGTSAGPAVSITPIHTAVPGRARFKVPGLYRSARMKARLENAFAGEDGINTIAANPLTGNVLVVFDPRHEIEQVAEMLARASNGNSPTSVSDDDPDPPEAKRAGAKVIDKLMSLRGAGKKAPFEGLPWHAIEAREVVEKAGASARFGLSSAAAGKRLRMYGPNLLPESAPRSALSMLLDQISSTPVLLLIAAAATSIVTGGLADAAVILGVVGIDAVIGFVTESQSERTIRSLKNVVSPSAVAVRDGKPRQIPAPAVVPGDVLVLGPGSYIAADCRLMEVDGLTVDESALTGESVPVAKVADRIGDAMAPLGDRLNMVYMGTLVTGGQGLAVVVATGRHTEVGRIQLLAAEADAPQTPMQRQLDRMGRQLVVGTSAVCVVIFGVGMLRGYPFLSMLQTAIALAVAAVPEGLPAIATSTLALGIQRMRDLKVLVRRLDAVETLGSVQAVCLDKTGTLTLNRMSVIAAHAGGRSFQIVDGQFREKGTTIDAGKDSLLERLLDICVLCSESVIEEHDGGYTVKGSPTENALINLALGAKRDVLRLRREHPTLKVRLRSEERSFMSTVHRASAVDDGRFVTLVKGSPEQVLAMCRWQLREGQQVPLRPEDRRAIEAHNESMGGNALRVLGCAWSEHQGDPPADEMEGGLVWLGLLGLADPVREGIREVISGFHRAGIDTVMITGDQSPTAFAIGNQLRLSRNGPLQILDSTHLANVDVDVLKALAERVHVFARVSPAHKLQIVRALQRANKVVAMTGDGINDSPALKAADIGIAMGTSGTEVAREVADVVLGDDHLETMLVAVGQGRTIYTNIRKSVHFLLSTNLSEVLVMFAGMVAGFGQPLSAMQLLWINLITDTSLGLALALDPPEPGVMEQPPRDPNEPIIRGRDVKRIGFEALTLSAGSLAAYGYGVARYGVGPRASTLGFTSLVSGQILHALSSRSERRTIFDRTSRAPNRFLDYAVGGSLALQGSVFLVPWLRNLLGVTNISLADTIVAAAGAMLPLLVNETAKKVLFRKGETVAPAFAAAS